MAVMVEYIINQGLCGIDDNGLITFYKFARNMHCYLSRAIDEAGLSITGSLTVGAWVWFNTLSRGNDTGIIGKWYHEGNQRSFVLHKKTNNELEFAVSFTGENILNTITDQGLNYGTGKWLYVVGRFIPSTEIAIFVNGVKYSSASKVFAAIYDGTEPLEVARYDRSNYMDGQMCHIFVSAEAISDIEIQAMYAHTKALFSPYPEYSSGIQGFAGVDERMTNAAVMIEYLLAPYLRMTNAAVMIEYLGPTYLRLTNAAVMIEYGFPTYLRQTNAAVEIEYVDTYDYIRMTNSAVMVEYAPTHDYIRQTNAAMMIEYEAV